MRAVSIGELEWLGVGKRRKEGREVTGREMISLPMTISGQLEPAFTTESSVWYPQFEDENENIRVELCPDEERVYCLYASVHYHSLRVFKVI